MIKHLLGTSFWVFIFVALALTLGMYVQQRQLIYLPAKGVPSRQAFNAEDMHQLKLHTIDGLTLNAWYKPAAASMPTLLFLHGNGGNIGYPMPLVRQYLDLGFGVLLLEYRGYGGNLGKPTEEGLYIDARTAMQYLAEQGIKPTELAIYGESLGTGVATKLATEYQLCALVLQSPYTSMAAVARYHYPWIFLSPWDKYDSLSRIGEIQAPLLIVHGTHDQLVPYSEGMELFQQAKEPKQMLGFKGRGHNNLWDPQFVQDTSHFIRTNCLHN